MDLLMIGGTVFLGRHIVESALKRGHNVTIFTRGMHNPDIFPEAVKLQGNRRESLDELKGKRFDVVIDTCGYFPADVAATATLLCDAVEHYTFISSISVYADTSNIGINEDASVGTTNNPEATEVTGENYGPLKALCEQAAEQAMPGRTLSIRPGLIVGRYDPTDRFTYWPHRVAQGGDFLVPAPEESPVQYIDVRDLAEWIVRMAEERKTGVYNATGPEYKLTMKEVIEDCIHAAGSGTTPIWVDEAFLLEQKVEPWSELPLWLPQTDEYAGFNRIDCGRAIANGLTFQPNLETVRDTLAWDTTLPQDRDLQAGIKPDREKQLLELWKQKGIETERD